MVVRSADAWLARPFYGNYRYVLRPVLAVVFGGRMTEMVEITNNEGQEAADAYIAQIAAENRFADAYAGALQAVVLNAVVGVIPGVLMGSDPFENAHGEPVDGVADEFE